MSELGLVGYIPFGRTIFNVNSLNYLFCPPMYTGLNPVMLFRLTLWAPSAQVFCVDTKSSISGMSNLSLSVLSKIIAVTLSP